MSSADFESKWRKYSDAWGGVSDEERRSLLQEAVANDIVFTGPGIKGQGVDLLLEQMSLFQNDSPGARFATKGLIAQNEQFLASWSMVDGQGGVMTTGHTYARLDAAGRIAHLAGFWEG